MRPSRSTRFGAAAALLASTFSSTANAHSWIERARRLAANGTMVGPEGFPRGYVPRGGSQSPDQLAVWLLPSTANAAYTGEEILNRYKPSENNADFPLLEASPGEHIAIMHLENGHTTLPENQPDKPRNRGTIFFYGTDNPKDEEKLFDIHLVWNRDGTGGDKRGKLIGTRNYDDGQCYQPNGSPIGDERVTELASEGAIRETELACQSDIQLPDDLKAGSTYSIYWYWDWPNLNPEKIDMEKTADGLYPWAGSFMRGATKDANGFTIDALALNESYSSVIDIKIVESQSSTVLQSTTFSAKQVADQFVDDQDVYNKGIKEQMENNFQVMVDVDGDTPGNVKAPETPIESSTPTGGDNATAPSNTGTAPAGGSTVTVTRLVTVPAETIVTTVTVSALPSDASSSTSTSTTTYGEVFIGTDVHGIENPPPLVQTSTLAPSSTAEAVPPTTTTPVVDFNTSAQLPATSFTAPSSFVTSVLSSAADEPDTISVPQATNTYATTTLIIPRPEITPFLRRARRSWALW